LAAPQNLTYRIDIAEGTRAEAESYSASVEKVRSRSMKEIRPNDDAIFGLICLPPQIDYGRLGLTPARAMWSPTSFWKDSAATTRSRAYLASV